MIGSKFPEFSRELREHSASGFHDLFGQVPPSEAVDWFSARGICAPEQYLDFLAEIGPGSFFAGSLVLFEVGSSNGPIDAATKKLPAADRFNLFAIGYDGTTEGCYCLSRSGEDDRVYWHNWATQETTEHHPGFTQWIDQCPVQLFSAKVYAGYKKIKDIAAVREVIRERKSFDVSLVDYDKRLVRPPGRDKDFLPRYNRLALVVRKYREAHLKQLTLRVRRSGSSVGKDNVEYVTIDLPDFPAGEEVRLEVFVFDPFNLPFHDISVEYSPEIELSSPMRVRFAEIKEYL